VNDPDAETQAARQELERIRRGVRTVPADRIKGAPDWVKTVEEMRDFFSSTARVWDRVFGTDAQRPLYRAVAGQIDETLQEVRILDLGCGTGLELEDIFARAPNACVTGIDLAPGMLAELRSKFRTRRSRIELIEASYVGRPLGERKFDYVVATLTVHHVAPREKLSLYRNIRAALKPHGMYVQGDQSTSPESEEEILDCYRRYIAGLPGGSKAEWNYDITLSPRTEERLLREAGFTRVRLTWERRDESGHGLAVFVAQDAPLEPSDPRAFRS
jgi:tRNA (cmo5U34)-methyltransferase